MRKKHKISLVIFLLIGSFFIILPNSISAQSPIIMVQGYIYIDNVETVPDEVSLMLPDQMRYASVYDYGNYVLIFPTLEPGTIGTFEVIISDKSYIPIETLIVEEDVFDYEIDLHIETSGGEQPPEDPTNFQPKSEAGGPYYGIENVPVDFDGSRSYDSDGTISDYSWDFGDGTKATGITTTHTYNTIGGYRVKLIVTDNKGKADLDITYAYITETPNNPPSKPIVNGTTSGTINSRYNYTILSTDIENDTIQYLIDWDDNTDHTVSDLLQNGTLYPVNHSWMYPGIYTIKSFAIDERDVVSQSTEQVILIDTIYCDNIGYMIDYTNDSIYDLFHSNITREETPVELIDSLYLIDDDNDGYPDYQYNTTTGETSDYVFEIKTTERTPTWLEIIQPYVPYILIAALIVSISTIPILIYKIRRTPKKKVYHVKDKKKTKAKETISNPKDERIKDIEKQVDELPSKKKS